MINFFRKKRKTLADDNKTFKYARYAIGEIVLVVIGILIALQINNWNEQNKVYKQQESYLNMVKREMMGNLKSLAIEKEQLSQTLNGSRKILNFINAPSQLDTISESEFSKTFSPTLGSDIIIQYENGALNQIIYSGGLKDIVNDSIRGILASWEGKINLVRLQEGQVNNAIEELKNLMVNYGEFRNIVEDLGFSKILGLDLTNNRGSNKNLLKLKEFENLLFKLSLTGYSLEQIEYPKFENEMQTLVDLINQELKEN